MTDYPMKKLLLLITTLLSIASVQAQDDTNKAILTLKNNTTRTFNTANVSSIDIDEAGNVTVNSGGQTEVFTGNVQKIHFVKKAEVINGEVQITEANGWFESLYAKWALIDGAKSYNVYVKGGQYASFTRIDAQLVRNYGTYGRADIVGLKAGSYDLKVIPVNNAGEEQPDKGSTVTGLTVRNYDRTGYAHFNYSKGIGAYNNDGTLKQGAKVFYVTKNTAKTITTNVVTDSKGGTTECTGLQAIIAAYEKGCDTTPIAFRFVGLVEKADLDAVGSKEEGIQVKGRKADSRNVVLIMTSNAGAQFASQSIGFNNSVSRGEAMMKQVKRTFKPEFLNRLSGAVVFHDMDKEMATLILHKKLRELDAKLEAKQVKMTLTTEAFDHLLKEGFTAEYGAREMDRVIAQQLKPLLMREILFGSLKQGGNVTVGIINCQLSIIN